MGNSAAKTKPRGNGEGSTSEQDRRQVNYLVNSYSDIKDVVLTIEKLISQTADTNKAELRKSCEVSIIPLQGRSGYVFRVKLHQSMLRQL